MSNPYIVLRNSVEQAAWTALTAEQKLVQANWTGHKFKVILGGYKPGFERLQNLTPTWGGFMDISIGPVFWQTQYVFRVSDQLSQAQLDQGFGTYDDLEAYFLLNNPQPLPGSPSNIITLTTHQGVEYDGLLVGNFVPDPMTTILDGEYAHFLIQIQFRAVEAIA